MVWSRYGLLYSRMNWVEVKTLKVSKTVRVCISLQTNIIVVKFKYNIGLFMNRGKMTGPPALQPDTYYHIFNRGINGENIFREERNYKYFLDLYAKYIDPVAETYTYCLLKNHFHLLVKTRNENEILTDANSKILDENKTLRVFETLRVSKPDPSSAFANFFNAYAKGFNKTYGRTGSLFEHPFRRILVTDDAQFTAVVRYIHQNPQKHGFVDDFRDWPYSSYESLTSDKVTRLNREAVQAWFGGCEGLARDHSIFMSDHKFGESMEFV